MWNTTQLCASLFANMLLVAAGLAYADPLPSDRGGVAERSEEAFEDLDRALSPDSAQEADIDDDEASTPAPTTDKASAPVATEIVVNTSQTNGRQTPLAAPSVNEPSQKELYERLLQEEAAGQGYTTEHDDVWVETRPDPVPASEPATTTVIIDGDEEYRRRYRRSGLWYFFHHLMTGRPHHVHRDTYRTHRAAKKAKRRAQADRRARRAVAERKAKRARAKRKARQARAEREARREIAERRARRAKAKRRASRRAAKRQRRASRSRTAEGRHSRRSR